ncbi:B3 domain-containing protein Os04g0386900 isoform X1 [Cannabis sativa]|uniref:B3 domain-containing protein Os04g0386900 isoform X1 n=1 Tax=Cannabis sativa TaxID=3483 RepID=UPI0011E05B79|nr:B3 domain-containing protein Os04g0386900 isoform X1 [Cannabis sativa]
MQIILKKSPFPSPIVKGSFFFFFLQVTFPILKAKALTSGWFGKWMSFCQMRAQIVVLHAMKKERKMKNFVQSQGRIPFSVSLCQSLISTLIIVWLVLPAKIHPVLPSLIIPAVLTYKRNKWTMLFNGTSQLLKRFDNSWKNFAEDNKLEINDACVFELIENSSTNLVFKVQILRGDLPTELLPKIIETKMVGTVESPIVIE